MNKKLLITTLTILGLTVIVGSFWYFSKLQKTKLQKTNTNLTQNNTTKNISNNQKQEQEKNQKQKNDNQNQIIDGELKPKEKIDTSDWNTYRNRKYGFEFKYPKDWKMVFQNKFDNHSNATILLYCMKKSKDVIKKSNNPLLSVIKLKTPGILINISETNSAEEYFFDKKKYIMDKYECFDKNTSVNSTKIIEWKKITVKNRNSNIYSFYYYKISICANSLKEGAIIKNNNILFDMENENNSSNFKSIIKTFRFF